MFEGFLGLSMVNRAVKKGACEINLVDLRDFAHDRHRTVDDRPYGGGPGMLMVPDVLTEAIESVRKPGSLVVLTSPRGEVFNQQIAAEFAKLDHLVLVAGHYEGVDQRVIDLAIDREISLGDFVMSSGNIAAMAIADAVIRLMPGVLGDDESSVEESHSMGLLEYPQYTRPAEFRGCRVPEVLLGGDHGKIAGFRRSEAEKVTRERRPDLWEKYLQTVMKEV